MLPVRISFSYPVSFIFSVIIGIAVVFANVKIYLQLLTTDKTKFVFVFETSAPLKF